MASWKAYPLDDGREHTVVGTVRVLAELQSPQLENVRDILVYLPPSYHRDERRYPVIYMQDGQNLFDRATSFGEEWRVDETMEAVSDEGLEAIVVGISNGGPERLDEYSPFVDPEKGGGFGERYLEFITATLKPLVDQEFRTLPDRADTGIVGSSMGALISLYAFFHHSDRFGFAGVMSPSLWFADRAIFAFVEAAPHLAGRIYLDVGTQEGEATLGDARRMRDLLVAKGYSAATLRYVEDAGAGHNESAWAERFANAVRFLLRHS